MRDYIITLASEIPLKSGRSKPRFVMKLIDNIVDAVKRSGSGSCSITYKHTKLFLTCESDVLNVLTKVFGVHRAGEVYKFELNDLSSIAEQIAEKAKESVRGKKFAVRVHRAGKHNFTSLDAERIIGEKLLPYSAGVDLETPEVTVKVEIRDDKAYLYKSTADGPDGLPIGIEGRALVLYSGGFDSPVAAWLTAKRGIEVDFLHLYLGDARSTYYAAKSMKYLSSNWLFGYSPKALVLNFTKIASFITKMVKRQYVQVVLRALMYMVASELLKRFSYDAVVTGESIGQTSSQTLANLKAIESVVKIPVPLLRPLIGMDKEEIIRRSRTIGTYELSSQVKEPCALVRTGVVTRAKVKDLMRELERINMKLLEEAVNSVKVVNVLDSDPIELLPDDVTEINFIPPNAIVVDVRPKYIWLRDQPEKTIHIEDFLTLDVMPKGILVFYCEYPEDALPFVKEFRKRGFKALFYVEKERERYELGPF